MLHVGRHAADLLSNAFTHMTQRKLYGTNTLVDAFIKGLTKLKTLDSGWTVKYLDIKTGQEWVRYVVDPDKGYCFNLSISNPEPSTNELIDIAFISEFDDEVSAASTRLYLDEQEFGKEYRTQLVERIREVLKNPLNSHEITRVETIIISSQLTDQVNNRDIIGKHYSEILEDATFFRLIAEEANSILKWLTLRD